MLIAKQFDARWRLKHVYHNRKSHKCYINYILIWVCLDSLTLVRLISHCICYVFLNQSMVILLLIND